jgi:hypothetical protein
MPTLEITAPADGSTVPANTPFLVGVQWASDLVVAAKAKKGKKKKTLLSSPQYTVTCNGQTYPTDAMPGSTTFSVTAGSAGTSTVVNAAIKDNDTGNVLASNSVTVYAASGGGGGAIGGDESRVGEPQGQVYVCGTYDTARTVSLVCITYQVAGDKTVPRTGNPLSPPFTVSKRMKRVLQYAVDLKNLKLQNGAWQATVPSSLIGGAPNPYQFGVWFLDAAGNVISQTSAPFDSVYRHEPCLK